MPYHPQNETIILVNILASIVRGLNNPVNMSRTGPGLEGPMRPTGALATPHGRTVPDTASKIYPNASRDVRYIGLNFKYI